MDRRHPRHGRFFSQGAASMTTRRQVTIVMITMLFLFAVGQMFLWTIPLAGR